MNNQIQLVLKSSTAEMSLNDHELGIYLTPELDGLVGLPEIRTTSGVNAGYDGGWTSAQNYDARSITIRGVIANTDVATVELLRKRLVSLAGQGKSEELTLDLVTEAGNAYTLQVRTIALEMAMQSVLEKQEFMLQLRADDPLIYDAGESAHEATLQVAKATGGFTIDFELPLAITGGSEESVVNNDGLEEVPTIVKMYGALHNPKIINQTNNEQMQIMADLGYAEGAWHSPSEASEGTNISLANTPDSAPFSDIQLKGGTYQQTYTGKNLLDSSSYEDAYINNTGVKIGGDGRNALFGYISVSPSTSYTISASSSTRFSAAFYNGTSFISRDANHDGASLTFTTPNNCSKVRCWVYKYEGVTKSYIDSLKLQLEKGSSPTSYEQYVGGAASPNPGYPQAVQTVTGENVVKICGKNLCSSAWENGAYNTTTGAKSTGSGYRTADFVAVQPNTTYIVSRASSGVAMNILEYNSSKAFTYYKGDAIGSGSSFTTQSDTRYITMYRGSSGGIDNMMLEKGSTISTYDPYQGQSYEVNLGKNLYDKDSADYNVYLGSESVTVNAQGNGWSIAIPVEVGQTYTFSRQFTAGQASDANYAFIGSAPAAGVAYIGGRQSLGTGTTFTATAPTGAKYLIIYYTWNATAAQKTDAKATFQIEKGSTATSYAAYFEPIELCKIGDYQDYIWNDNGTWKVHKAVGKYTFTSSETVSYQSSFPRFMVNFSHGQNATAGVVTLAKSTHFVVGQTASVDGTFGIAANVIYLHNNAITSVNGLKTWFGNNNVSVYFVLATPTDTEITNAALIEQLENLLNLSRTYQGQTNLSSTYVSGNMPAILNVSYYTEKELDTRDELIIDSRLHTVTLNGLDIYHLIGEGSEFLMLEPGENRLSLQSDITGDNGYAVVSYKQGYLSI